MGKKDKNIKKKKHIVLKILLFILVVMVLFIGGFVGYSTYKNGWGVKGMIQTAMGQDQKKLENLDPFTVLIMGVSEDISVKLTDTIIVASYNPKTQKATLLSIPRDTFIGTNKNKASSYDKINALYQTKTKEKDTSPEKTLDAVNKITGLNITYYIVVSNNALVQLVDAIGGVEFDVPIDMDYDDSSQDLYIHLKKGYQKLSGEQAEWLVRFRHNNNGSSYPNDYGNNDLGRMKTQREFLKVVAKQVIQVKNITKLGTFIDIFKENVQTNITNWTLMKDYIPYLIDFDTENIQTETLPGNPSSFGPYNLSFFVHNEKQTKELVNKLFTEQNYVEEEETQENTTENTATSAPATEATPTSSSISTSSNSKVKIEMLNGCGDNTLFSKAKKTLENEGYTIEKTGTTTETGKTTIINKTSLPGDTTSKLKETLGIGIVSNSNSSANKVDATVVIGKDYK